MHRLASRALRLAAVVGVAAGLAACATPAATGPSPPLALGPGEWRVSAAPVGALSGRMAALRRAAELTLAQGGDWFRVLPPPGPDARRYRNPDLMSDFASPVDETGAEPGLDVAVGRGAKPADMDAYDARQVAGHLGARTPPPRAPGAAAI